MSEKQHNERVTTRYDGVHQRESRVKRHKGRPDVCYTIDYRDPVTNKRVRKSVGWLSEGVTAEYANKVRLGLLAKGVKESFSHAVPVAHDVPTLAQAWDMYRRDWLEARKAAALNGDTGIYKRYLQSLAPKPLNAITSHDLDALSTGLQRKGLSPQTAKHTLALVRRIMRKMIAWRKWTGPTPFDSVTLPRVNSARQRFLTPKEAHALLEMLHERSPRMWIMALISLHCGLRFGEIAALCHADIDIANKLIFVRDPKGGHDRHAHMTDHVGTALKNIPARKPSALLFPSRTGGVMEAKSAAFTRVVDELGLNKDITDRRQKVVFHTLRHTYASWLALSGQGQTVIADMLGHASLEMSRRYTHLMPDTRKAAASAIDVIFNKNEHEEPQQ